MKLRIILALVASAAMAGAQTASPFRIVNGQLYNIEKSKLWQDYQLEVKRTDTNSLVAIQFTYGTRYVPASELPPNQFGVRQGEYFEDRNKKIYGTQTLVLHPPSKPLPADGQELRVRALRIGTTNIDGHTLEVLDCGTTNLVRAVTTNRPALK